MQLGATLQTKDEKLEAALIAVEDIEPDYEKALLDFFDLDAEHKIRKADEFLRSDGTEKKREAESIKATADLLRKRNRAEAVKKFLEVKLKDRQDAVSARQSLLSAEVKTNQRF